jgi:hypothetical protein
MLDALRVIVAAGQVALGLMGIWVSIFSQPQSPQQKKKWFFALPPWEFP